MSSSPIVSAPFQLYSFWRSSATYRVRVALALKGLSAQETNIDIDKNEQHDADFLAISPLGAIPVLVQEGHAPITQSTAILEFLDEFQPSPPLLPGDLYGRARVRSIASMCAADVHPLMVPRIKKYLQVTGGFDDPGWRAWQTNWFNVGLKAVEARLAGEGETGMFCHGDTPTTADICLASIIAVKRVFKIEVADIPVIERIMATCDAHPAFAGAAPKRQFGAPG